MVLLSPNTFANIPTVWAWALMLPEPPVYPAPLLARTWDCQPQPERTLAYVLIEQATLGNPYIPYATAVLAWFGYGHAIDSVRAQTWVTQYRLELVQPDPEDAFTWYYAPTFNWVTEMIPYYLDGTITRTGSRCKQADYPPTNPA